MEAALHRKFSSYQVRNEWFEPSSELMGFISSIESIVPAQLLPDGEWPGKNPTPQRFKRIEVVESEVQSVTDPVLDIKDAADESILRPDDKLLTLEDVASYLRIPLITVRRFIKNGDLKAFSLAGWKIRKRDLRTFIEERSNRSNVTH